MKRFSLRSILVVFLIGALLMSLIVTSLRLREVNEELEVVRRNYGHMTIEDASKIYVVSLAQERRSQRDALRFIVPPGERYFLHLSETTAEDNATLPHGKAKTTVALNSWADGEDVILHYGMYVNPESNTPYLRVTTRNQGLFTYRPEDWPSDVGMKTVFQLEATEQIEISLNEPIVLFRALSESLNRGIVLWLEPETHRESREAAAE